MKLLDIVHPAAKVLADISMSQDAEARHHPSEALSIFINERDAYTKQQEVFTASSLHFD